MRIKLFIVPVLDPTQGEGEVNRFLASHRVLSIERDVVQQPGGAVWR